MATCAVDLVNRRLCRRSDATCKTAFTAQPLLLEFVLAAGPVRLIYLYGAEPTLDFVVFAF